MIDSVWVCSTESQLSNVQNSIDSLQCQYASLRVKSDVLTSIVETSNGSMSNQLTAANYLLALVAVVIVIVGALLGFYIRRKKLEVETMVKIVENKKKIVDDIAATTKELDKQIHSNIKELYQKLRMEETNALLDRLMLEPRDIVNLIRLLLARDLDDEGFYKVRTAYLKMKTEIATDSDVSDDYNMLFFQHYCYQAVKDDQIRPSFIMGFYDNCGYAFRRDIVKTTIDLCKALTDETSTFNKEEVLITYLKALNGCQHKNLADLKNVLEQNITPQTLLQNAIEQCKQDGVYLELFGISKAEEDSVRVQEQ